MQLSSVDRKILNCIQEDIPLESKPFEILSKRLGIKEEVLLEKTRQLKSNGIVRSLAAGISHKKLGFKSSLIALKVHPDNIESIARQIVAYPEVTHCFLRAGDYNLWTVFIYKNNGLETFLKRMARQVGKENILNLATQKQFKLKTVIKL